LAIARQNGLVSHNRYRAKHHAQNLQLDDDLNTIAQTYAEHLASTGNLIHSSGNRLGENLYQTCSSDGVPDGLSK
jgi:uncharacterized protein YkwD